VAIQTVACLLIAAVPYLQAISAERIAKTASPRTAGTSVLQRQYASNFSKAIQILDAAGIGTLWPDGGRVPLSSFEDASVELKLKSASLREFNGLAARLELARLACSTGNLLLAEMHIELATAATPENRLLSRWRAVIAATRFLNAGRETDLARIRLELEASADFESVDRACVLMVDCRPVKRPCR
jgi:hypothetical protein